MKKLFNQKNKTDNSDKKIISDAPDLSRRKALMTSAMAMGSLPLQSLVTGLSVPFLASLSNPALAMTPEEAATMLEAKYMVFSHRNAGDSVNANAPGSYGMSASDPLHGIDHATVAELGDKADGFENPATFNLGNQTVKGAQAWASLPADLRRRLSFWNHSTFANAHPDFPTVRRFNGAIKGLDGTGSDEIAALLAQETHAALGTLFTDPVTVGGDALTSAGRALPVFKPQDIKNLFSSNVRNLEMMINLRDKTIDEAYRTVKNSGTPAQRKFLDTYATGRSEAKLVGDQLGELITDINGNDALNQSKMAVALLQLNIAPVVSMGLRFGSDNHGDADLVDEVDETAQGIAAIKMFWSKAKQAGIADQVVYASLNTFGRTLKRNTTGGRDHNGNQHSMFVFGSNIKGGIVGGIEPMAGDFGAMAINAQTGGTTAPDIPFEQTLAACGKTLAKAVGISDERINLRISGGKVITGALV